MEYVENQANYRELQDTSDCSLW